MDKTELQRLNFLKELKARELLRVAVRKAIRTVMESKKMDKYTEDFEKQSVLEEESVLRAYIQNYLKESTATQDNDPSPHRSTGINVLSDLLKKIIPVLEVDYKQLTTDTDQRASFRAHVIHGVKNSLAPLQATDDVGPDSEQALEEEVGVTIGGGNESDQFIDIDDGVDDAEELSPEEEFATGMTGQDLTGRNMAYSSFKKIERNILDAYELLSNDEDQELFYDYLITNLKLYFDKFEDELATNLDEPTTPEYEDAADVVEPEEDFAPAAEEPMPEEGEEELAEKWYTVSLSNGLGSSSSAKVKGKSKK